MLARTNVLWYYNSVLNLSRRNVRVETKVSALFVFMGKSPHGIPSNTYIHQRRNYNGKCKIYQKLIVLEPDDFETKIVDEVNYPLTKEGQERLNQRMEVYNDQKGVVCVVLELSSNTEIIVKRKDM